MKCQNCGNEEVNFQYTSNINGNITVNHYCAKCASELGYTDDSKTQPEMSFEEVFADLFGVQPSRRMFTGYGIVFPTIIIQAAGVIKHDNETTTDDPEMPDTDAQEASTEIKTEIDEVMKKRREFNVLRERMRQAAETEDFETAAALRDSIKQLESEQSL